MSWRATGLLTVMLTVAMDTHIVKEHVYSFGTGLLQCRIQRLYGLVVVGSIKPKLFHVLHFCITSSKPWEGGGGISVKRKEMGERRGRGGGEEEERRREGGGEE